LADLHRLFFEDHTQLLRCPRLALKIPAASSDRQRRFISRPGFDVLTERTVHVPKIQVPCGPQTIWRSGLIRRRAENDRFSCAAGGEIRTSADVETAPQLTEHHRPSEARLTERGKRGRNGWPVTFELPV